MEEKRKSIDLERIASYINDFYIVAGSNYKEKDIGKTMHVIIPALSDKDYEIKCCGLEVNDTLRKKLASKEGLTFKSAFCAIPFIFYDNFYDFSFKNEEERLSNVNKLMHHIHVELPAGQGRSISIWFKLA